MKNIIKKEYIELLTGVKDSLLPIELQVYNHGIAWRELELIIPLSRDPVAKQSFRVSVRRHKSDSSKYVYKVINGETGNVRNGPRKGDVMLYINKFNMIDVFLDNYQKSDITKMEAELKDKIRKRLPYNFVPFDRIVEILALDIVFTINKTATKKMHDIVQSGYIVPKLTKPDSDNLLKLIKDAMNEVVYKDDNIIWQDAPTRKIIGKNPFIYIKLRGV